MFSTLLRAAITFAAAPLLLWAWALGMNPVIEVIDELGAEGSQNADWLATTVEWLPLIVLLSLIIWVINGALVQRQSTRGWA